MVWFKALKGKKIKTTWKKNKIKSKHRIPSVRYLHWKTRKKHTKATNSMTINANLNAIITSDKIKIITLTSMQSAVPSAFWNNKENCTTPFSRMFFSMLFQFKITKNFKSMHVNANHSTFWSNETSKHMLNIYLNIPKTEFNGGYFINFHVFHFNHFICIYTSISFALFINRFSSQMLCILIYWV